MTTEQVNTGQPSRTPGAGPPTIRIGASAIHGRGVYAVSAIAAGQLIERCPVLLVPAAQRELLDRTSLYDYYFTWADGGAAIALGLGSLYNHEDDPCARYRKDFAAAVVDFIADRDIAAGEEITVDYTDGGLNRLWFTQHRAVPPGDPG